MRLLGDKKMMRSIVVSVFVSLSLCGCVGVGEREREMDIYRIVVLCAWS